jgi:hypothetical protein
MDLGTMLAILGPSRKSDTDGLLLSVSPADEVPEDEDDSFPFLLSFDDFLEDLLEELLDELSGTLSSFVFVLLDGAFFVDLGTMLAILGPSGKSGTARLLLSLSPADEVPEDEDDSFPFLLCLDDFLEGLLEELLDELSGTSSSLVFVRLDKSFLIDLGTMLAMLGASGKSGTAHFLLSLSPADEVPEDEDDSFPFLTCFVDFLEDLLKELLDELSGTSSSFVFVRLDEAFFVDLGTMPVVLGPSAKLGSSIEVCSRFELLSESAKSGTDHASLLLEPSSKTEGDVFLTTLDPDFFLDRPLSLLATEIAGLSKAGVDPKDKLPRES